MKCNVTILLLASTQLVATSCHQTLRPVLPAISVGLIVTHVSRPTFGRRCDLHFSSIVQHLVPVPGAALRVQSDCGVFTVIGTVWTGVTLT